MINEEASNVRYALFGGREGADGCTKARKHTEILQHKNDAKHD